MRGLLYTQDTRFESSAVWDVLRFLNDDRAFLPVATPGGGQPFGSGSVVAKAHVMRVTIAPLGPLPAGDVEPWAVAAEASLECCVVLRDGTRRSGRVLVETPPSLSRLGDRMNAGGAFLPLMTTEGLDFIARSHVLTAF
jgi:hypothetical protein